MASDRPVRLPPLAWLGILPPLLLVARLTVVAGLAGGILIAMGVVGIVSLLPITLGCIAVGPLILAARALDACEARNRITPRTTTACVAIPLPSVLSAIPL